MNVEVLWSSAWPNKTLVVTMPARCSFDIIARHKGLVVIGLHPAGQGAGMAPQCRR